jgi:hypothetical protein
MTLQAAVIEYAGIRFTADAVIELKSGQPVRAVRRPEITSIVLRRSPASKHPVMQLALGVVLVALGLYPCLRLFNWWRHGGAVHPHELTMLVWLAVGAWMVFEAIARRLCLLVQTPTTMHKMALQGTIDKDTLNDFIRQAEMEYGYIVEFRLG